VVQTTDADTIHEGNALQIENAGLIDSLSHIHFDCKSGVAGEGVRMELKIGQYLRYTT
jgi:hypothetical protein